MIGVLSLQKRPWQSLQIIIQQSLCNNETFRVFKQFASRDERRNEIHQQRDLQRDTTQELTHYFGPLVCQ